MLLEVQLIYERIFGHEMSGIEELDAYGTREGRIHQQDDASSSAAEAGVYVVLDVCGMGQ